MRTPIRPLAHARGSVKRMVDARRSVTLLAVILVEVGCGSIGEPLYPALRIPSPVNDLTVVEHGNNLDINFTIPPLTTEGLPLKEIGGVELRVGPGSINGWNADD